MPDLRDRFDAADQIPVGDLWADVQERLLADDPPARPRLHAVGSPASRQGSMRKVLTIAAAFAIAVPAIATSVRAFRQPESSISENPPLVSTRALSVTEYPVPSDYGLDAITAGPQGGAWFVLPDDEEIGRITGAGAVVTFPLPGQDPVGITQGARGSAWFTESGAFGGCDPHPPFCPSTDGVGRIDASGNIKEFPLPPNIWPGGITLGADGNLWFTEDARIGRMTPSGAVTTFPARLHNDPWNIVAGPDGAMWFTEDGFLGRGTGAIGRMTTSGSLTEYILPTPAGRRSGAGSIAVGPDGNLWFTWVTSEGPGQVAASIGRITPSGTITRFPVSRDHGLSEGGIAAGPDGSLWFTLGSANMIGRIRVTGTVTLFRLPTANSGPSDITKGSHGFMWFSEGETSAIGRFRVRGT